MFQPTLGGLLREDFPVNILEWKIPFDHIFKFLQIIPEGKSTAKIHELQAS